MEVSSATLCTGVTVSYAEQGDRNGPALVLLPGPTDSWASYRPVLDHLPPTIRTLAVSPRGHGDSEKPPSGYRVDELARDVVAFLRARGIERAVLVGHSGSCLVARRVAIAWPERVAGLVLEASPTTLRGDAGLQAFVDELVRPLDDPIDPAFARSFIADTASDALGAELVDELVAEVLKVPAHVWREVFDGLLTHDGLDEVGRLRVPTLLVWGDADGIVPRTMQDDLVARTGADLVVYEGVGHTPRWEEPARFARDLGAFVAQVSPVR